jgi:hypothetical protein
MDHYSNQVINFISSKLRKLLLIAGALTLCLSLALGIVQAASSAGDASATIAYRTATLGKSVEDLVGAFSIEKTIKLGGNSPCSSSSCLADPLDALGAGSPGRASMEDDTPSCLSGFDFQPRALNLNTSAGTVNFIVHIVDDESGLLGDGSNRSTISFESPSKSQSAEVKLSPSNLASGNLRDGIYYANMTLPRNSERGSWLIQRVTLVDSKGNRQALSRQDLISHGMPSELLVL